VADIFSEEALATQGFKFRAAIDVHQLRTFMGLPYIAPVHDVHARDCPALGSHAG